MHKLSVFMLAIAPLTSASAAVYDLSFEGELYLIDGEGNGDLVAGDPIRARLSLDTDAANLGNILSIGGGTYSIYDAPLSTFQVSVGDYSFEGPVRSSLTYIDDAWGGDAIVFGIGGLPGGPFGSAFTNLQFRLHGSTSAIDHTGIRNGIPFENMNPDFFAAFGGGNSQVRTFGTLRVFRSAVPEPDTWALLTVGFGAIGASLRRHHGSARQRRRA